MVKQRPRVPILLMGILIGDLSISDHPEKAWDWKTSIAFISFLRETPCQWQRSGPVVVAALENPILLHCRHY